MRLALVNPNTSAATTAAMVAIAEETAPGVAVQGVTAPYGVPLITEPAALATAAEVVVSLAPMLGGFDAVVVAAFGDPGLADLKAVLECPVTGLAEAGMAEAAEGGRRFAVATTTPDLVPAISAAAARYGLSFVGTWTTAGNPATLTADPDALVTALERACRSAVVDGGAEAVIIGGGPLARAARVLAGRVGVPLIEPVPAAVRLSLRRHASSLGDQACA